MIGVMMYFICYCMANSDFTSSITIRMPSNPNANFDNIKANKSIDFNSCTVISEYLLDITSIKKATEYRNDK